MKRQFFNKSLFIGNYDVTLEREGENFYIRKYLISDGPIIHREMW